MLSRPRSLFAMFRRKTNFGFLILIPMMTTGAIKRHNFFWASFVIRRIACYFKGYVARVANENWNYVANA